MELTANSSNTKCVANPKGSDNLTIQRLFRARAESIGTLIALSWFMIIGPWGGLLLGGIAYFLATESPALGLFCTFIFFSPLVLMIIGGFIMCFFPGTEEEPTQKRGLQHSLHKLTNPSP